MRPRIIFYHHEAVGVVPELGVGIYSFQFIFGKIFDETFPAAPFTIVPNALGTVNGIVGFKKGIRERVHE